LKYLTVLEAAKYLNKSDKTIRKYITTGKLKGIVWENGPFGERQMIPLEALERLRNSNRSSIPFPPQPQEPLEAPLEQAGTPGLVPMYDIQTFLKLADHAVDERVKARVEPLETRLKALEGGLEARLEERDQRLVEVMRRLMEEKQEEEKKKRPWWARVFIKF
jgi:excisionase family DNA binding protein